MEERECEDQNVHFTSQESSCIIFLTLSEKCFPQGTVTTRINGNITRMPIRQQLLPLFIKQMVLCIFLYTCERSAESKYVQRVLKIQTPFNSMYSLRLSIPHGQMFVNTRQQTY